jgi:hypothetical protein
MRQYGTAGQYVVSRKHARDRQLENTPLCDFAEQALISNGAHVDVDYGLRAGFGGQQRYKSRKRQAKSRHASHVSNACAQ